ncbi:MAG: ribosome maturation factor RimM [Gammaproteobacteria bacterium]|nr:ribosome maturation factor RimM [Gammaproteobacteria bacterium]
MERQDGQLVVGRVVGLYGVQGWVKIESYTDPWENIRNYGPWQLSARGQTRTLSVESVKLQGKGLIARFEGIDNRDLAARLVGSRISVSSNQLPDLAVGEYYWHDLIGLTVINRQAQELGQVDSLFETGANDVLVVKKDQHEYLIPYLPEQVVLAVDLDKGRIQVDWETEH